MSIKNLSSDNIQKLVKNILQKAYSKIETAIATREPKVANQPGNGIRVLTRRSNGIGSYSNDLIVTTSGSSDKTLWGGVYQ